MKTKLASVLGLAVLVASFIFGGSLVYADALEATSSEMQTITLDAIMIGAESELSCVLDGAGADICAVAVKLAEADQPSAAAREIELSTTEESPVPAIQFVGAIVVEVTQTVTIAVPGQDAVSGEEPANTGSISEPAAAEPVVMLDTETTTEAAAAPAMQTVDAIVVEVTQTATVAAPGEDVKDGEEPAHTGSIPEQPAAAPVLVVDANDLDD
jgi:hypothetical protein